MNFGNSKTSSGSKERALNSSRIASLIKDCIKHYDAVDSSIQIMVTELECTDPDCVPLETLVALLGENARWTMKILKPLNEVTKSDVNALPFPLSWSSWIEEYAFMKSQPDALLWINDNVDTFEDKITHLTVADQLSAILLMEKALQNLRIRVISTEQTASEQIVAPSVTSSSAIELPTNGGAVLPAAVIPDLNSTVVSMRRKTDAEINYSTELISSKREKLLGSSVNASNEKLDPTCSFPSSSRSVETDKISTVIPPKGNTSTGIDNSSASDNIVSDSDLLKSPGSVAVAFSSSGSIQAKTVNIINKTAPQLLISSSDALSGITKRHKKGSRPRGCPCCDPDSIDNIVDKMIFLESPP